MALAPRLVLVLLTGALLWIPGVAWAAPTAQLVGETRSAATLLTDGERYAAFESALGVARVLDTRDPTRPAEVVLRRPEDRCPDRYETTHLAAIGAGMILWDCGQAVPKAMLTDVVTGVSHEPLRLFGGLGGDATGFTAVGRHWIAGVASGYHWRLHRFLNWQTGARRGDARSARVAADLDSPELHRRLCAPLRRARNLDRDSTESVPTFQPYEFQRPWGLTWRGEGYRAERGYRRAVLVLERCGRGPVARLTRSGAGAQLGGGLVSWSTPRRIHVHVTATGKRHGWTLAELGVAPGPRDHLQTVAHTRAAIFFSVLRLGASPPRTEVYAIPAPARRPRP